MNVVAYLLGHAWTNRKWEWSGLGRQQLGDGICWHSLRLTAILGKQLAIPDDNPLQNHKQTRSTNPSSRKVHATLPTNSWHLTPRGSWTLKGRRGLLQLALLLTLLALLLSVMPTLQSHHVMTLAISNTHPTLTSIITCVADRLTLWSQHWTYYS